MNTLRSIAIALFLAGSACPGQGLVVNELLPGGAGPDRVELLNQGKKARDLKGLRFSLGERLAVLSEKRMIGAGGRCILEFDPRNDSADVPFGLPRSGGTLLMIAADGYTILDICTWPAMPEGVSIGRQPDGSASWSYFAEPSFGARNPALPVRRTLTPAPSADIKAGIVEAGTAVTMTALPGATIRYTTDGSEPSSEHGTVFTAAIPIERTTIIRARAFAENALPSTVLTATYVVAQVGPRLVAINAPLPNAWNGEDAEGTLEWYFHGDHGLRSIVLRESGSGSRSYPKRNLKVSVRASKKVPWPNGGSGDEVLLRADATPDAFLRNLFMECVARDAGGHVDVQNSEPVELLLNTEYHGLYRWMPPKDKQWLSALYDHEAFDILHGPSMRRIAGDRQHFHGAYEDLLSGAPIDTLAELMDLSSLIDLACFDLWTGRADHDLNVRCWRPKEPGGRWRWVLYDMDLWAPPHDNSVQRMCSEAAPVAPYVPQLLAHNDLRARLLARMSALTATVLSKERGMTVLDSLYRSHGAAMARDHDRWKSEMERPAPEAARAGLADMVLQRSVFVLGHLAAYTGQRSRSMQVQASPRSGGTVLVEGIAPTSMPYTIEAFKGAPLKLKAVAADGYEFAGWRSLDGAEEIEVDAARTNKVTALFRRTGTSRHDGLQQSGEERLAVRVP